MQNLKIKVNTAEESREVQELLFELGYNWFNHVFDNYVESLEIYADTEGDLTTDATIRLGGESAYKETTLAELRGMVNPMQEYLNKNTYEYKLAHSKPCGEWVCIPEGAIEARLTPSGSINFINSDSDYMNRVTGGEWVSTHRFKHDDAGHKIIWQRPTQPEALPFIDDNPQSLNEQYAEIEQVRQAVKVKSGSDSDHMADAMSYGLMGGIEATLAERGSRYGDFESVAETTRALMRVLDDGDTFNELSASQYEALHMICSKMARIVNGDPDYRDNWHDIGGYAKLIENNI